MKDSTMMKYIKLNEKQQQQEKYKFSTYWNRRVSVSARSGYEKSEKKTITVV